MGTPTRGRRSANVKGSTRLEAGPPTTSCRARDPRTRRSATSRRGRSGSPGAWWARRHDVSGRGAGYVGAPRSMRRARRSTPSVCHLARPAPARSAVWDGPVVRPRARRWSRRSLPPRPLESTAAAGSWRRFQPFQCRHGRPRPGIGPRPSVGAAVPAGPDSRLPMPTVTIAPRTSARSRTGPRVDGPRIRWGSGGPPPPSMACSARSPERPRSRRMSGAYAVSTRTGTRCQASFM